MVVLLGGMNQQLCWGGQNDNEDHGTALLTIHFGIPQVWLIPVYPALKSVKTKNVTTSQILEQFIALDNPPCVDNFPMETHGFPLNPWRVSGLVKLVSSTDTSTVHAAVVICSVKRVTRFTGQLLPVGRSPAVMAIWNPVWGSNGLLIV